MEKCLVDNIFINYLVNQKYAKNQGTVRKNKTRTYGANL